MKKLIVISLLVTMMICCVGCGESDNNGATSQTTTVANTTPTTVASSTSNNNPAAYIYDGTGSKQGDKIATVRWNEKDKISVISNMINTNNAITKSGEGNKKAVKTDDAEEIYVIELINKGVSNNIFFVYVIDDKIYMMGEEFSKDANAEIKGYADITVDEFHSLLK